MGGRKDIENSLIPDPMMIADMSFNLRFLNFLFIGIVNKGLKKRRFQRENEDKRLKLNMSAQNASFS